MPNKIPEVDAYIAGCAEFAQPILKKIRKAAHKACPDIEEVIKWSTPFFQKDGLVAGMAGFKAHVRLSFWAGVQMKDPDGILDAHGNTGMSGVQFTKESEMPTQKVLVAYFKEAIALNEGKKAGSGARQSTKKKAAVKKAIRLPADLAAALKKNKKASATFKAFSPTHKKEYVEWLLEAKREATREKRLAQAIVWMAEGKPRNWKYMKKW